MRKSVKFLSLGLATVILTTPFMEIGRASAEVSGEQVANGDLNTNNELYNNLTLDQKEDFAYIVNYFGYDNEQQLALLQLKSELQAPQIQPRGKVGIALKTAKAIFDELPTSVQKKFGTQAKFVAILATYEHFTGDIEKQIIADLKKKGFSNTQANITAKIITFLAF